MKFRSNNSNKAEKQRFETKTVQTIEIYITGHGL